MKWPQGIVYLVFVKGAGYMVRSEGHGDTVTRIVGITCARAAKSTCRRFVTMD